MDDYQNTPSTICEVLALDEAREAALLKTGAAALDEFIPHAERIGTVTTDSEFIASKYVDCRLFFRHSDGSLRKELR